MKTIMIYDYQYEFLADLADNVDSKRIVLMPEVIEFLIREYKESREIPPYEEHINREVSGLRGEEGL